MTLDKLSWQLDGGFPEDLPEEQGMAHMGVFLAWALLHGHGSVNITEPRPDVVERLQRRELTPGELLPDLGIEWLDEEEFDEDFWPHAEAAYETFCSAHDDHAKSLGLENSFYLPGSWETYDALAPMLDALHPTPQAPSPQEPPPTAPRRTTAHAQQPQRSDEEREEGRGWGHWLLGLGVILVLKAAWRAMGDGLASDTKLGVIIGGFALAAVGGWMMWRDRRRG